MEKHTFEEIKELLLKSINEDDCESELTIRFIDRDSAYMIIIYDDYSRLEKAYEQINIDVNNYTEEAKFSDNLKLIFSKM